MYQSWVSVLALVAGAHAMNQIIDVGKGGSLAFNPNSLTAAVGDTLEFHFYSGSGGHSVVSSTFENPCVPNTGGFFSGYPVADTNGDATFVVNVTSTDPIWFYCSLSSHCQSGMAGVVNPPSGKSITDYTNAAMSVKRASAPASVIGGVLTTINEATESTMMMTVTTGSGGPLETATTSTTSSVRGGVQATPTTGSGGPLETATTSTTSSSVRGGDQATPTSSGSTPAATTKSDGRRSSDMSVVLGLGVVAGGLAMLMG